MEFYERSNNHYDTNTLDSEFEALYKTLMGSLKISATKGIYINDLIMLTNRMYNFSNDICHNGRNYFEYYLSPFLENDFFRLLMQYPYQEKMNYKLYYYLLRTQSDYFSNVPTENTKNVLPKFWAVYKLHRFNPLKIVWNAFFTRDVNYDSLHNIELKELLLFKFKNSSFFKDLMEENLNFNKMDVLLKMLTLLNYEEKISEYKTDYERTE